MITNQIMHRELYGTTIEQRTKDGFFNATSLLKFFNNKISKNKEIKEFFRNKNTQRFLKELEKEIRGDNSTPVKYPLYILAKNRNTSTWMHPYLFVKFAMWLSPKFEVRVIKYVYDNLITYRIQAGDEYKDMCTALQQDYINQHHEKPDHHLFIREAKQLNNLVFGKPEYRLRNQANEKQLQLMNHLQRANTRLLKKGIPPAQRYEMLNQFAEMYL